MRDFASCIHRRAAIKDMEGHLAELDINPLMVLPAGHRVEAADALVVFRGT
jgi:succinyl-CoA synthetase beta subunit